MSAFANEFDEITWHCSRFNQLKRWSRDHRSRNVNTRPMTSHHSLQYRLHGCHLATQFNDIKYFRLYTVAFRRYQLHEPRDLGPPCPITWLVRVLICWPSNCLAAWCGQHVVWFRDDQHVHCPCTQTISGLCLAEIFAVEENAITAIVPLRAEGEYYSTA